MKARVRTLVIGAALILVANAIALTGVAYNRSGEPESRLVLSERELARPWNRGADKENSGLSLGLQWRVPDPDPDSYSYYATQGGVPAWLDEKRLAELGFDVERARGGDNYLGHSERQVLVVLELAGPAWQQALAQARRRLAHQASLREASPEAREFDEAEKRAREALAREEGENSRLFAVDAGTDLESLRAKYPDRSRYLILEGSARLHRGFRDEKPVVTGYLGDLGVGRINVPHRLRGSFEAMPPRGAGRKPPFAATVAVGQRLEPWIEAVATP